MNLPASDQGRLVERGADFTVATDANMLCVTIRSFALPSGYDRAHADLLLRLSPGYPDIPPDMWWFFPAVKRASGTPIPATESQETYLGQTWQRWSRHLQPGQWKSGIDGLESYLALIRSELEKSAKG